MSQGKRKDQAAAEKPQPPAMDPQAGDKTPAYVEWLRDHNPQEFERRYKNRKTHLTQNE